MSIAEHVRRFHALRDRWHVSPARLSVKPHRTTHNGPWKKRTLLGIFLKKPSIGAGMVF